MVTTSPYEHHHEPANLIDGNPNTVWHSAGQESVWVRIKFPKPVKMTELRMVTGRPGNRFTKNNRIKIARLLFGDGSKREVTFADRQDMQSVKITPPVTSNILRIEIIEAYYGTRWRHNIIGEVEVWGTS